ncbi:unnamed protein product [Ceutorhynchus assimilis]|uniref:Ribosome receptor lysine/proline rich domain-containing protein n=1 Tax=Ceutorhynchus assimilis TaxID=467358 RepID=A0A9P0DKY6_9CUCU|nr:unnamed protein product [Ceutorhynchus assimilis]
MDVTAPLIFFSIFIFASIALFLVYKYGIKKKTFEEALAEHKKQTSALLGPKIKPKEKKSKKAAKKANKEKAIPENGEMPDETESLDSKDVQDNVEMKPQPQVKSHKGKAALNKQTKEKIHVEFKEEPEEALEVKVPVEKEVKDVINKKDDLQKEAPKEERKQDKKKIKPQKQDVQQVGEKPNNAAGEPLATEKEKAKEEKATENILAPLVQESVVNTGKEKKKKKSEFNSKQQVIVAERDQLIHSIRNAELSRNEVQLLIDLLLNKQLEAPTVVDDWSEGKFDPVQKLKKQLADKEKQLEDEQEAHVGVQAKLKEVRNEQLAERAQLLQKIKASEDSKLELAAAHNRMQQRLQELEELRNKELTNFKRLLEENNNLVIQRAQFENTLLGYQETDNIIHGLKTENAQLTNDLQLLSQERQEQATNYQNCIIQNQAMQEELRRMGEYCKGLERNHGFVLTAKQDEIRQVADQLKIASENHTKEEQKLKDIIAQLTAEKEKLQEEKSLQINGSSEESKIHEVKVLNLTNELSSVKSELTSVSQSLLDAERQYKTEICVSQEKYNQLKNELEEQKNKNDELRKKNWKVMEALNAAESRNNKPVAANKDADINVDQITSEIKSREQNAQKEFIQRLFPEIDSLKTVSSTDWQNKYEQAIREHISQLQKTVSETSETAKLQKEVQVYKKVLDETDESLKSLQLRADQAERSWRQELAEKESEIQDLKNRITSHESQLQEKVLKLENQVVHEQSEKARLIEERQQLLNKSGVKSVQSDSMATIERLSEEVNYLKEQLRIEQSKNSEASVYQNGETS